MRMEMINENKKMAFKDAGISLFSIFIYPSTQKELELKILNIAKYFHDLCG